MPCPTSAGSDRLRGCLIRLDQLNEISFFGGRLHKERCVHLRQTLLWLNRGQGIGFCVFGVPTPPNISLDPVTFPIHRLILWSRL